MSLENIKAVMEMQFADFVTVGFNQIINNLAKINYRWSQNADVVIRMPTGGGVGAGPFHSQSNEAWFTHTPGLKVVYPSTAHDAKGLMIAAINDPKTYVLVAMTEGDGVVGCASITFEGQACQFGKFAVHPSQQAGGIGKLLLAAAEQAAITNFSVSTMKMLVIDGRKELEAFYERRGYARTGNIAHMADLHTSDDMTIGHDLVLNEYVKPLIFNL